MKKKTTLPSFKSFVQEARKNPEQNPKVSAYQALKQYSDDPTIYISFTDIDKVGINPKSKFNTPLGIYCYNLEQAWNMYDVDRRKDLKGLPFAADRPNIYVLQAKVNDSFIEDMYSEYGSDKYDKDIKILKDIWMKEAPKLKDYFISYDFEGDYEKAVQNVEKYTDIVGEMNPDETNSGYNKFQDKLKLAKSELESLNKERLRYIETRAWTDLVDVSLASAKEKNSVMSFWNLTRMMAIKFSGGQEGLPAATKWNWLLRQCGYSGFGDLSSRGYIHPSEPMQTVFLSTKSFQVIDKVSNKDYKNKQNIKSINDMIHLVNEKQLNLPLVLNVLYGYDKAPLTFKGGAITLTVSHDELMKTIDYENCNWLLVNTLKYFMSGNVSNMDSLKSVCENIFPPLLKPDGPFLSGELAPLKIWYKKLIDFGRD